MNDNRNMILAIVLSALVLFGWTIITERFFPTAAPPATKVVDGRTVPVTDPKLNPEIDRPAVIRNRAEVLADSPRVAIRTDAVTGSINLKGARIDDLSLLRHRVTIDRNSPPVRLLSPAGARDANFAGSGWTGDGVTLPGPDTLWTADRQVLTPATPVTLRWDNGQGQTFAKRISIDDNYMFTIEQSVSNAGSGAIAVKPFAFVSRTGAMTTPDSWTIHTGPIGAFNGAVDYDTNFEDVDEAGRNGITLPTKGGWFGFTDLYWLTAIIPGNDDSVSATFRAGNAPGAYQADFAGEAEIVAPGSTASETVRLFAGAKEVKTLDDYEDALGIVHFGRAVDWGWFEIVEKPIFYLLDWLFRYFGNFGVAIIALTIIVRLIMFPIAQKQFASMAGMRAVQPKMKELQERYKDDKQKLQVEMLELYKREKVNPLAGCLPILLQIPIFFALYKVLLLAIEMRHQPFALWIKDLSAPDPLTPVNLFGLLDFTPPAFIAIGVLPILLGITMWMQFKLQPASPDPVQQQVFAIMPWVFMFIMAPFAAGLQLYWTVSNILTIAQQKWLYSRHPALKQPLKT